jgi:hypothetical protein
MHNANKAEGERYLEAIRERDRDLLVWLIYKEYPTVLWGAVTKQLSADDYAWAVNAVRRAA